MVKKDNIRLTITLPKKFYEATKEFQLATNIRTYSQFVALCIGIGTQELLKKFKEEKEDETNNESN